MFEPIYRDFSGAFRNQAYVESKENTLEKEDKSWQRSLIRPIKVSGSNGRDVQGFVEPLKDEGPAMAQNESRWSGEKCYS